MRLIALIARLKTLSTELGVLQRKEDIEGHLEAAQGHIEQAIEQMNEFRWMKTNGGK